MTVRFDPAGPCAVGDVDTFFARPTGVELVARIYRPHGEPERPLEALVRDFTGRHQARS